MSARAPRVVEYCRGAELSAAVRFAFEERVRLAGPDWVGTREACSLLCCHREAIWELRRAFPHSLRGRSAGRTESARGAGLLIWREDVLRLVAIKKRTRLTLRRACMVLEALKVGGPL